MRVVLGSEEAFRGESVRVRAILMRIFGNRAAIAVSDMVQLRSRNRLQRLERAFSEEIQTRIFGKAVEGGERTASRQSFSAQIDRQV
jgi:hypothetical protein